ncbi:non-ribosomal peptide synthetase [Aquimarina pacifica]|uniref:non-ribosomal peptide synthetase n=1 Tax=Aquimarina pacifica TaxID=1296415 RepID=UPI0004B5DA78|nr:non-ribosomal peptide synthetase [Aquimarina pacifica]
MFSKVKGGFDKKIFRQVCDTFLQQSELYSVSKNLINTNQCLEDNIAGSCYIELSLDAKQSVQSKINDLRLLGGELTDSEDARFIFYDIEILNNQNVDRYFFLIVYHRSHIDVSLYDFDIKIQKIYNSEIHENTIVLQDAYLAPYTEEEVAICAIWEKELDVERVGVTDNFFKIGGDSISSLKVSHRMSEYLFRDIKVSDFFEYETITQLLTHSLNAPYIEIPQTTAKQSVLSFAQERLWFIEKFEEGTNAYHMHSLFEVGSKANLKGVKYALEQIVLRHEVLRSVLTFGEQNQGIQIVREAAPEIKELDLNINDSYEEVIRKDINRPFNLSSEYPIRVHIYHVKDGKETVKRLLLINVHHIADDGWSKNIFQSELFTYYEAFIKNNSEFNLPALDIQYKDYAIWQRSYLTGDLLKTQLDYWSAKLSDFQTLEIPTDYVRPKEIDYKGYQEVFTLNKDLSGKLRKLSKNEGTTLHSILLSSVYILLGKHSGQDDIVVGSAIANRHHRQTENLIGFFVNMQVNRGGLKKGESFKSLISEVHRDQIESQLHQDVPFEKLVDELGIDRDNSRHPVFQVTFNVQSFDGTSENTEEQKKVLNPYHLESAYEVAKFDLSIFIDDSKEELKGKFIYAASLFKKESVERLIENYIHLLTELTNFPDKNYDRLCVLETRAYDTIINTWNKTNTLFPNSSTLHGLFEQQVVKTPKTLAVIFEDDQLTYEELNTKSNQLARHIRAEYEQRFNEPLKSDTLIALCLDRSIEMIVGIFAVLKAGGAYVPIDPDYPQHRVDYILEDTQTPIILSKLSVTEVSLPKEKTINIDLNADFYDLEESVNLGVSTSSKDLAYIIYTSGTTGKPKGVMIEHMGVCNYLHAQHTFLNTPIGKRFYLLHSYAFDTSISCIFGSLCSSNTLVITENSKKLQHSVYKTYDINIAYIPPALLGAIDKKEVSSLDTLIISGELADANILNKFSGINLINEYGPTEATVGATYHRMTSQSKINVIGKLLNNKKAYVLDAQGIPVAIGVTGELYIGGVGLSRGYLNREDLTKERFVSNPFATDEEIANGNHLLYKTGDLVCWSSDGNLEYIGRNDDQVKIRGHRIELDEVANALSSINGIHQSNVLVKERQTSSETALKYLVGYYILDDAYALENDSNILNDWEQLYDDGYQNEVEQSQMEADFSGWNSYITGEPIPLSQMEAWRDYIIDTIKSLSPTNVLEVGVGSGLLMYPLLKDVSRYVGLDISYQIIKRHQGYLKNTNNNTALYHLRADQLNLLPTEELFDTIVVNSVCQYFPSIHYFEDFLNKSIKKLSNGGKLYLGDLRNYDLHHELIIEKFDFEGFDYDSYDVDAVALKENEFLISPNYFLDLATTYNEIQVEVIERPTDHEYTNELYTYRYDVVLSIKENSSVTNYTNLKKTKSKEKSTYNIPFKSQLSKENIIASLSEVLPDYMVPSFVMPLKNFPLTVNGKIDKLALPDPDFDEQRDDYVAPRTSIENQICTLWSEVLGVSKVGVTDNFFAIGGNSISAIHISHRMSELLEKEIKISAIFKFKKIAELLTHGLTSSTVNIPKTNDKVNLMSFAQERLWFIEQYEKETNAYHIPMVFEIPSETDISGIKHALTKIVARHSILRSTLDIGAEQDGFLFEQDNDVFINEVEVSDTINFHSYIQKDINTSFDLSNEYPIKIYVYRIISSDDTSRNVLLINMHHIASDGWSINIFLKELYAFYEEYIGKKEHVAIPELTIQYKDYAVWQRNFFTGSVLNTQLNYWKNKLQGYQNLQFPTDYTRPNSISYKGAKCTFTFSKELSKKLREISKSYGVSLNSSLLSGIGILLSKYTGQEDIVIGGVMANRHYKQTENLIGLFVNTLANRIVLNNTQNYKELVAQVHKDQIDVQLYQDFPFEKLIEELEVVRDSSRHPIFQILFGVQSFGGNVETQNQYLVPFELEGKEEVSKFDMSILIDDSDEEMLGTINYATSLFKEATVLKLIGNYKYLLEQLVATPEEAYSDSSLLRDEEYKKVVFDWNATEAYYEEDTTIHELFEEQVAKTPDAVALVYEGQELTYKDLNSRSNQLARHIRSVYKSRTGDELAPDTLIALCFDRSIEMIIGMLGVLKAGGAYVPIDPEYPSDRISYILEDTQSELVLSQNHLCDLALPKAHVISIDEGSNFYQDESTSNLPSYSTSSDLAYVIYTSGTTGKPKGVMIAHVSLHNYVSSVKEIILPEVNTVDFSTKLSFDLTVTTTICPLLLGKRIAIYSGTLNDVRQYAKHIVENKVDFVKNTPSLLGNIPLDYFSEYKIKQAFIGGEKLENFQLVHVLKYITTPIDEYGPTETTVGVTHSKKEQVSSNTNIGGPIKNIKLYILDTNMQPVPVGVVGELFVGGAGLSRGYLNRPELTKERFISNPFATEEDISNGYTKIYKTGDLVRWLPDGNLAYIGRNDDQVKIRGYRIELGEIESSMNTIDGISQSCVLAKERVTESGVSNYLVGYYVLDTDSLTDDFILEHLSKTLPDYMIPSSLVKLESFPLTINEKLDRAALPEVDFTISEYTYVAPETANEKAMCDLWKELLKLEKIGITDDFFKMGGDSILSIKAAYRMSDILGKEINVADIFRCKNIDAILKDVFASEEEEGITLEF